MKLSFEKIIEITKCFFLLVIIIFLAGIYINTSRITKSITWTDLRTAKDKEKIVNQIPLINIHSGKVDVEGSVSVDGGYISIDN